jgi:hypothetical protein
MNFDGYSEKDFYIYKVNDNFEEEVDKFLEDGRIYHYGLREEGVNPIELKAFISSHYRPIETSLDKEEVKKAIRGTYHDSGSEYDDGCKSIITQKIEDCDCWQSDLLTTLGLESK